jgi:hypothetical protein
MKTSWKSAIVMFGAVVAVAALGLGSAYPPQARNESALDCNLPAPLTHCAAEASFGYPIGDGLVITLFEEFF